MIRKLNRLMRFYFHFALISMISLTAWTVYFQWREGLLDPYQSSSISDISYVLDEARRPEQFKNIINLVENDNVRVALKTLEELEEKISRIGKFRYGKEDFLRIKKVTVQVKKSMMDLVSSPDITSLVKVFANKVNSFNEFSLDNKWRTLVRIGQRIYAKVAELKGSDFKYMKKLNRLLLQDILIMRKVTETSALPLEQKSEIFIRLKSLEVEMAMLEKYIDNIIEFSNGFSNFRDVVLSWLDKIGPQLSMDKITLQDKNRQFHYLLLANILLGLFFMFTGVIIHHRSIVKGEKRIADFVASFIKENIISSKMKSNQYFGHNFQLEMDKIHQYVQKRMGLSSMFQEAMPFASVLLDQQLKVIWANSLFCEAWKLNDSDEVNKQLSWDFLVRFTNLGDSDPVQDALESDCAGIYQILLKADQSSAAIPYEMYVGPVNVDQQKRVMLFFYPLSFMEETIANQGLSMVGPIRKTLEFLVSERFDESFKNNIANDFTVAGIEDVLNKFESYHHTVKNHKNHLENEIEKLENIIHDHHKILGDVRSKNVSFKTSQEELLQQLKRIKKTILSLININYSNEKLFNDAMELNKGLFKKSYSLLEAIRYLNDKIDSSAKSLEPLLKVKQELKNVKNTIQVSKARLGQLLDQCLGFKKSSNLDQEKYEHGLLKIKNETRNMDKEFIQLDKLMTSFDIITSKIEMVLENDSGIINKDLLLNSKKELGQMERESDHLSVDNNQITQDHHFIEDNVVSCMSEMYQLITSNLQFHGDVEHLIGELDHSTGAPFYEEKADALVHSAAAMVPEESALVPVLVEDLGLGEERSVAEINATAANIYGTFRSSSQRTTVQL